MDKRIIAVTFLIVLIKRVVLFAEKIGVNYELVEHDVVIDPKPILYDYDRRYELYRLSHVAYRKADRPNRRFISLEAFNKRITGLEECTEYEIRATYNDDVTVEFFVKTLYKRGTLKLESIDVNVSKNDVEITWKASLVKCLKNFYIQACNRDTKECQQKEEIWPTRKFHSLTLENDCDDFDISIELVDIANRTFLYRKKIKRYHKATVSEITENSAVLSIQDRTNESLILEYSECFDMEACQWDRQTLEASEAIVSLVSLKPCKQYAYTIYHPTKGQSGCYSYFTTLAEFYHPVINFQSIMANSTENLLITWNRPNKMDCIKHYEILSNANNDWIAIPRDRNATMMEIQDSNQNHTFSMKIKYNNGEYSEPTETTFFIPNENESK